jgi:biopolymer transport protein TolR
VESGDRDRIRSEINVTPLVDVCLVLLIIFMVVAPILTNGPSIKLPRTNNPDRRPEGKNQLPITVLFDKPPQILFGKEFRRLDLDQLKQVALDKYRESPDTEIVLRADRLLTYGDVRAVLSVVREAGFRNVGLIAEREVSEPIH